jgi:predicted NBD/HSP70 family sugar kinase
LGGEIAHVITTGPDGRACPLTEVFARLNLRHQESTAIDVDALIGTVDRDNARSRRVRAALGEAIAGVISAAIALTDPSTIVVGGPWGTHSAVQKSLHAHVAKLSRRPTVRPAAITTGAPLAGARAEAIAALRRSITQYRQADNA